MIRSLFHSNHIKITEALLNKDWSDFKTIIQSAIQNNDFEKAFWLLEGMGYFGWKYNFIRSFSDSAVDQLIVDLSLSISEKLPELPLISNRIVFYDYFGTENKNFTLQYLEVIIKNGFEVLYIIEDEKKFSEKNTAVITINNYSKGSLLVLPNEQKRTEKLYTLLSEIKDFAPTKIFVQNAPWDILSYCFSYLLSETGIKTYLLNITDHAYWPGKNCFSYFIDFRQYGSQLNKELRKIPTDQLLIIPTPSSKTISENEHFQGFPEGLANKIIGFSGGSYYKIIDENNTFLLLIKEVIQQNPDFVLLFANVGGDFEIHEFIKKHQLEGRFIPIGFRKDINEVFKRIDIYFNTYPYGGGLMMQYAIANKKPILAYWNEQIYHARIDKVLDKHLDEQYIIKDKSTYLETAQRLITDKDFRVHFAAGMYEGFQVSTLFEKRLSDLLQNITPSPISYEEAFVLDMDAIIDFHIKTDKLYLNEYPLLANKYLSKNFKVLTKQKKGIKKTILELLKKSTPNSIQFFLINSLSSIFFKILESDSFKEKLKWQQRRDIDQSKMELKFCGAYTLLGEGYQFENPQFISIGNNFSAGQNLRLEAINSEGKDSSHPELTIGNSATVKNNCQISCAHKIIIGDNVLMGNNVFIADYIYDDARFENRKLKPIKILSVSKGPIIIEDNVILGDNVTISANLTIGKNSMIGANSIIKESIPANSIVTCTTNIVVNQM